MKKIFSAAFLAVVATPAAAADLPVKASALPVPNPIYSWTGFYVGGNVGYGQNHNCWDLNGSVLIPGFAGPFPQGCNDAHGALVGGQVGYRQQFNNLVVGLEIQADWADLTGRHASTVTQPRFVLSSVNSTKTDSLYMFTGQVGWSFGHVLWYVKGGGAVTDNKYDQGPGVLPAGAQLAFAATAHADEVKLGGVLGTGVDIMFAPNWTIGVEYDHLFMGTRNVGFALTSFTSPIGIGAPRPGFPTQNMSISSDIDMATVRLNYKFGP